jgi:hypothetical protein
MGKAQRAHQKGFCGDGHGLSTFAHPTDFPQIFHKAGWFSHGGCPEVEGLDKG